MGRPIQSRWLMAVLGVLLSATSQGSTAAGAGSNPIGPTEQGATQPGPTPAAVGEVLADITVPVPHSGCCGTALDFDGTYLWYANWNDDKLFAITAGGALAKSLTVGTGITALSWDRTRHVMYVCQQGLVSQVDTTAADGSTVAAVNLFQSDCFDGLAYDSSDETFYLGPDAQGQVTQYSRSGGFIRNASLPFPRSGIVVGDTGHLYMGANGTGTIYKVAKDTLESVSEFANPGGRDEDLACDNNSFVDKTAIWSIDAYANRILAFEVDPATCSFVGKPPSITKSSLDFAAGANRFVPADGKESTKLVAVVKNSSGKPIRGRSVRLVPERAADLATVQASCPEKTDRNGRTVCTVRSTSPGSVSLRLSDAASGVDLGSARRVEFTRKVVVLVMGFNSSLPRRFCYWGNGEPTSVWPDCEVMADLRLGDQGTVYGRLAAGLGYRAGKTLTSTDAGATIVEMSWEEAPCIAGSSSRDCVATVLEAPSGDDVGWIPPYYDIGGIKGLDSVDRQRHIDDWAKRLVRTLRTYDRELARTRGIHASFHLVGHSMGGELVVRAVGRAIRDDYFTTPARRGLLRTVIAVDGAMNWDGTDVHQFQHDFEIPKRDRERHCGSPVHTVPDKGRERDNTAAVEAAHTLLGTTTIALTNGNDWVVPFDPRLVQIPMALLEQPDKPKSGYGKRLFWGYGSGATADPDCGHSTLLRSQPGGLYRDKGRTDPAPAFPLGDLLAKYIGRASGEQGLALTQVTRIGAAGAIGDEHDASSRVKPSPTPDHATAESPAPSGTTTPEPSANPTGAVEPDIEASSAPAPTTIPGPSHQTPAEPEIPSEPGPERDVTSEPTPGPTPINQRPTADAGGPYEVDEGGTVELDGSASSDPDGEIVTYEWSREKRLDDPTKRRPTFSAVDDGKVEIELTVTDDQGATNSDQAVIRVRNVDPRIPDIGPFEVTVGDALRLDGEVRDPGEQDTHAVQVDWGDGASGDADVDQGARTWSAHHSYAEAGQYELVVTVTDDDGGSGTLTAAVRVSRASSEDEADPASNRPAEERASEEASPAP